MYFDQNKTPLARHRNVFAMSTLGQGSSLSHESFQEKKDTRIEVYGMNPILLLDGPPLCPRLLDAVSYLQR